MSLRIYKMVQNFERNEWTPLGSRVAISLWASYLYMLLAGRV